MDELSAAVSPEQSPNEDSAATPLSESYSNDADEIESVVSVVSDHVRYHNIRGRDYVTCGEVTYWRPCNPEFDELLHYTFKRLIEAGSYEEPFLVNPQKVLDVGTGAGFWATGFADEHPSAFVIGTDVADKIAPTSVPPNLEILIEDCTGVWSFHASSFDFIHARGLIGAIMNWEAFFAEAYRCLKPGQWFETIEPSFRIENRSHSIAADSPLRRWEHFFVKSGEKRGTSFAILEEDTQRRTMEKVGFIDIQEQGLKIPVGGWPQDDDSRGTGLLMRAALENDIEGTFYPLAEDRWGDDCILLLALEFRKELHRKDLELSIEYKAVRGKKPYDHGFEH